ncbi:TonB-dependent receptor [Tenacibaculum caenipelagi]|uniref:Iron complex outermembrane receptor protein n=1 Tax=Tenacibaculum caenipelagi TaxID=1325435 RepID=A0A4V3D3K1_9FLAO|nr:TonB-dependent receptor [Tenacibaculum caenipelagi]TDQ30092.1 iron complex outermembrane receptor protein [Tenacibaculum caenipelagi]
MKFYIIVAALFLSFGVSAQSSLKGKIKDEKGQPIYGVNIHISELQKGTTSDENGDFILTNIKEGTLKVTFSIVGFQTEIKKILFTKNSTIEVLQILKEDSESLNEVVVSASRRSEYLSEIPASITVVNQKQLVDLSNSTTNINEILEFTVPGLAVSTGTYSNWGQTLRGRSLLVMIDGIPQSTPLRNGQLGIKSISPNDISRVEVIKGATSIFGNGGNGGFINYITKKPQASKEIEGATNLWQTSSLTKMKDAQGIGIYQSLKGNLNKFTYYVSGSYERTGNKYDAKGKVILPTYGFDNTNIYTALAKLEYQISDNQKIILGGNLYNSLQDSPFIAVPGTFEVYNENGDYSLTPGYGVEGSIEGQEPTGSKLSNGQLTYNLNHIFGGSTDLETDVYYQKAKNTFFYSDKFENGGQSVINAEKYGVRPNFNTTLDISPTTNISLTYGLDLLKDKTNQGLLDGRLWVPNINMLSWAPYMQSTIKFNNKWVLKAGLRYDDMNLTIDDYNTLPYSPLGDGNFNPSVAVEGGKVGFDNLAFNAGVRYIKHQEFIPYVSYSQGFSIADLGSVLRSAKADSVEDIQLEPAVTKNYEFGFLSKFKNFRLEAVGYYSVSNLGTGVTFDENINSFVPSKKPQNIYGGEIAIDYTAFDSKLQIGTSYSYVEGLTHDVGDKNNLTYLGGDVIAAPKLTAYVTWIPTEKISTSLRMTNLGDRNRFNPYLDANDNYTFRHTQFPVEGYTLLNWSMNYKLQEDISVSLAVNNLLNEYYLPARSQWAAPLRTFTGTGEGINAKLSMLYNF